MFKNTFQSGFLSILYSIGSKPLQIWDKKVRGRGAARPGSARRLGAGHCVQRGPGRGRVPRLVRGQREVGAPCQRRGEGCVWGCVWGGVERPGAQCGWIRVVRRRRGFPSARSPPADMMALIAPASA